MRKSWESLGEGDVVLLFCLLRCDVVLFCIGVLYDVDVFVGMESLFVCVGILFVLYYG